MKSFDACIQNHMSYSISKEAWQCTLKMKAIASKAEDKSIKNYFKYKANNYKKGIKDMEKEDYLDYGHSLETTLLTIIDNMRELTVFIKNFSLKSKQSMSYSYFMDSYQEIILNLDKILTTVTPLTSNIKCNTYKDYISNIHRGSSIIKSLAEILNNININIFYKNSKDYYTLAVTGLDLITNSILKIIELESKKIKIYLQ